MTQVHEIIPKAINLKTKLLYSIVIAFIISIIVSIFIYFIEKSINYSLIGVLFVILFLSVLFVYKKGLTGEVQFKKTDVSYNILAELNYHIRDFKMKWIFIIDIIFLLIFLIAGIFSLILRLYITSVLLFGLAIIYVIITFLGDYKLNFNCKITDKGIIISSLLLKPGMIRWININSYELTNRVIYLNLKNLAVSRFPFLYLRFPVLNQKKKIIRILNSHIKKKK